MPDARCARCDNPFTADEWDQRHTEEESGGDVHAYCCEEAWCRGHFEEPEYRCETCGSSDVVHEVTHLRTAKTRYGEVSTGWETLTCNACGAVEQAQYTDL